MAYSHDFRCKVLAVRERDHLSIAQAAERFAVGSASVTRWLKRVERKPSGARRGKLDIAALEQDLREYPDAYPYERAARLGVRQSTICYALKKKLRVSYKKTQYHPRADAAARDAFQARQAAYEAAGRPLVWIDESGFFQGHAASAGLCSDWATLLWRVCQIFCVNAVLVSGVRVASGPRIEWRSD
ncbi:MAG: IS630 transposase-related protein [Candidatus Competibacter denitrificans]